MRKLFRRDFLKYTAAGASLLAADHILGGLAGAVTGQERPYVNRNTGKRVKGIPTTCAGCSAGCGIIAYVHDGMLMKIKGNPAHPVNKGKLCIVGEAGMYSYYDPERVAAPMKRTGKRGAGQFREITWDEAREILADKLKASRGKLVVETKGGATEKASEEFVSKFRGKLVSHGYQVTPGREKALMDMFGSPVDVPDVANANLVINFGANPYSSDPFGVATAAAIATRRADNGALRLVTFDPRLSETAGRSDEWHPLLPGTDGVVALAMAHVIMKEGLFDKGFIEKRTDTTVSGLREMLSSYTPEAAQRISGVGADDIRKLAVLYAKTDRAVILTGGGVSSHAHGAENERAVRLLPVITGKVNRTGCNIVASGARPTASDMTPGELYSGIIGGGIKPAAYIVHACDPAFSSPESDKFAAKLADENAMPFIAVIDTHVSDTGTYADLVLPMTTYLEEYSVESGPGPDGELLVRYRSPVVEPTGSSKPYVDILAEAARQTGAQLSFRSAHSFSEAAAYALPELPSPGGMAKLEASGFYSAAKHGQNASVRGATFKTKSGRIEVSSRDGDGPAPLSVADALDTWKDGEFALVAFTPVGYKQGFTENNLYLKELNHSNWALINPDAGRALGLRNRDKVVLSSPAGRIELPVMLSPGVQRNTVAVASGCGHRGYGNIERGKRFRSADPFTHVIWWGHGMHGDNPNRVVSASAKTGPDAWTVAKVNIHKA